MTKPWDFSGLAWVPQLGGDGVVEAIATMMGWRVALVQARRRCEELPSGSDEQLAAEQVEYMVFEAWGIAVDELDTLIEAMLDAADAQAARRAGAGA